MYIPTKVFILELNNYKEISYEEFCLYKETDISYKEKWFISLHGMLMEVSKKDYINFYRERRRQKYLNERSKKKKDVSYDMFTTDELNGEDILKDSLPDVSEIVEHKILLDRLREIILLLTEDEQLLIKQHFFQGISENKLGEIYGISQQAISKRLVKIQKKLKKLIEH